MSENQNVVHPCPLVDYVYAPPPGPPLAMFEKMDGLQDAARPAVWTDDLDGYWMFTDHSVILDAYQQPDLWSSEIITPQMRDSFFRMIPVMLDPPEHTRWRQLLGGWFTPNRTRGMMDEQRRLAREIIEGVRSKGECDFVADVAQVFPSAIFLQMMGMPFEMLDQFLEWEDLVLHQDSTSDPDNMKQMTGMQRVTDYFTELVAERRRNPDPDATDIVSAAVGWTIDGEPVDDMDLVNCLFLLFTAGLDTVAAQSSYALYHLANHSQDRARIVAEPGLVPQAVEEVLRVYPIAQPGRKATRDMDFHGCPVKAGDIAVLPLAAAGRDEAIYPDARRVDLDRTVTRHLSFGAGPHRCIGSHLARQELVVLLEEWHALIPDYTLVEAPRERGAAVWSLESLKLRWDV